MALIKLDYSFRGRIYGGLGSIGGMMLMSLLVGLPLHFTALRFERANVVVRGLAGTFSLGFGVFMAYEIGFVAGLLR